MPKGFFDLDGFYSAVDAQRQSQKKNWKDVATEAQVSASSLARMKKGQRPDVDTMAALLAWSGLNANDFALTQ